MQQGFARDLDSAEEAVPAVGRRFAVGLRSLSSLCTTPGAARSTASITTTTRTRETSE